MARAGVHDHLRRFVDDDDVLVLIDDIERDVLRDDVLRLGCRDLP
jgi:hypothetical protein